MSQSRRLASLKASRASVLLPPRLFRHFPASMMLLLSRAPRAHDLSLVDKAVFDLSSPKSHSSIPIRTDHPCRSSATYRWLTSCISMASHLADHALVACLPTFDTPAKVEDVTRDRRFLGVKRRTFPPGVARRRSLNGERTEPGRRRGPRHQGQMGKRQPQSPITAIGKINL